MTARLAAHRIRLEGLSVEYGDVRAVDGLDLTVEPGEIFAILGPSGCGKTTTLKAIAGLESPAAGEIWFDDRVVSAMPPYRRRVGMVFQSYALFEHMTVRANIRFGLAMHKVPRTEQDDRIDQMLGLLQIADQADAYPGQLSGGQQQRVALARTLVIEPAVLLLDEPLSALDRQLREIMRTELRRILKEVGITSLLVTHDQEEALTMADRVAVMRAGRIEQVATPRDLYVMPRTRFVGRFIGQINELGGSVENVAGDGSQADVRLSEGTLVTAVARSACKVGETVQVAVRPETLVMGPPGFTLAETDGPVNRVRGRIAGETFVGDRCWFTVVLGDGTEVSVLRTENPLIQIPGTDYDKGAPVDLAWAVRRTVILGDD